MQSSSNAFAAIRADGRASRPDHFGWPPGVFVTFCSDIDGICYTLELPHTQQQSFMTVTGLGG